MKYNFQKQFKDSEHAWKLIYALSQFLQKHPNIDLNFELKDNVVKIKSKNDYSHLATFIDNYFQSDNNSQKMFRLFCDGGSRGNPGPGASGYIILDNQDVVMTSGGQFFPECTNNQAEYRSLEQGLRASLDLNLVNLQIYMDSQLVVKQVKGEYKVKNKQLLYIYKQIMPLLGQLDAYEINFVPRKYNKQADSIVNQILDDNLN